MYPINNNLLSGRICGILCASNWENHTWFLLVVYLGCTTIGKKQVDKFINFQTQNTCHIKINGMWK